MDLENNSSSNRRMLSILSTLRAVEIAANAAQSAIQGQPIEKEFAELYRECGVLNVLCDWNGLKDQKNNTEEFEMEPGIKEEETEINRKELRFIEIMQSKPGEISKDMKNEAFELFPEVISSIGWMD